MSEPLAAGARLAGWKEIAEYLGVSVRTAQTFEKEHGLPVHRGTGIKPAVYTFVGELEEWGVANPSNDEVPVEMPTPSAMAPVSAGHSVTEEPPDALAPERRPVKHQPLSKPVVIALLGATTVVGFGIVGFYWFRPKGQPSDFTVEGRLLTVMDERNRFLWEYTFPNIIAPQRATSERWPHTFVGLDSNKLLIFGTGRELYCFSRFGRKLWVHSVGHEVVNKQGVPVPENYGISLVGALSRPRRDGGWIIVGAHRGPGALYVVEVLTKEGTRVAEYFHFGWFFGMKIGVLGSDGQEDIFLAGVDSSGGDDYGATLVVLDPSDVDGQATTMVPDFRGALRNVPTAHEKAVLLIREFAPNPDPTAYCRGRWIVIASKSLDLHVDQDGPARPSAWFRFDSKLRLENVLPDLYLQSRLEQNILKNVQGLEWQETLRNALGDVKYVRNEFK